MMPNSQTRQEIAGAVEDALGPMSRVLGDLRDRLDRVAARNGLDSYDVRQYVRETWGFTFPVRDEFDESNVPVDGPAYDLPADCYFTTRHYASREEMRVTVSCRLFHSGPFRWYHVLGFGRVNVVSEKFSTLGPVEQVSQRLEAMKNRLAGIVLAADRVNKASGDGIANLTDPLPLPPLPAGQRFAVSFPIAHPRGIVLRVRGTALRRNCGTPQLHELPTRLHDAMTELAERAHVAALR